MKVRWADQAGSVGLAAFAGTFDDFGARTSPHGPSGPSPHSAETPIQAGGSSDEIALGTRFTGRVPVGGEHRGHHTGTAFGGRRPTSSFGSLERAAVQVRGRRRIAGHIGGNQGNRQRSIPAGCWGMAAGVAAKVASGVQQCVGHKTPEGPCRQARTLSFFTHATVESASGFGRPEHRHLPRTQSQPKAANAAGTNGAQRRWIT